jgi:general secretion pathway protein N
MRWRLSQRTVVAGLVAFGAYLVWLLAFAPATLLDAIANRSTGGRLRLAEAQGTLWSGTGHLEVRDASGLRGIGRNLVWQFQPQALLRGRLGFQFNVADSAKNFAASFSPFSAEIADAGFVLPAAALGLAVPRVALIEPTGDLLVHVPRLVVADKQISGKVLVQWQAAGSSLSPVSPLGDYELRIEGESGGLEATLATLKGPLHLDGKGPLGSAGPPVFKVSAWVEPQWQAQLIPFLRLIAVERETGRFELQLAGNMGQVQGIAGDPVRQ